MSGAAPRETDGARLVQSVRKAISALLDYMTAGDWEEEAAKLYIRMLAGAAGDDWQAARAWAREQAANAMTAGSNSVGALDVPHDD